MLNKKHLPQNSTYYKMQKTLYLQIKLNAQVAISKDRQN